jgi:hypothetical protein
MIILSHCTLLNLLSANPESRISSFAISVLAFRVPTRQRLPEGRQRLCGPIVMLPLQPFRRQRSSQLVQHVRFLFSRVLYTAPLGRCNVPVSAGRNHRASNSTVLCRRGLQTMLTVRSHVVRKSYSAVKAVLHRHDGHHDMYCTCTVLLVGLQRAIYCIQTPSKVVPASREKSH